VRIINFTLFLLFTANSVFAQDSLNVSVLFHWDDPTIPLEPIYGLSYNEIWGVEIQGNEYAIIGSTLGTHIFDVTDPVNSTQVVFIPGAQDQVLHRDYHDYNGYLYMVCDEGNGTLQIADLSYLPNSAPVVYDSDTLFSTTHNIFIDTLNGVLYNTNGGVYSLANPEVPSEIANVNLTVLFDQSHDLYVSNDTAYWHAGSSGLHVYDYSVSMSNPTFLGSSIVGPGSGYNHSGWLNEEGNIYAFAEETYNTDIQICDVSNLPNISVVSTVNSGGGTGSIPHNLIIKGDYLFISYYHDGIYIFDISNPANPSLVGFYDTEPNPSSPFSFIGAWGVYPSLPSGIVLVSDTRNGLFVLDVSDATSGIEELSSTSKELVKIVDAMGRETKYKPNTILIYVYNDGTTKKVFSVE
jgi:choice-of-anchor B domain-containing protein